MRKSGIAYDTTELDDAEFEALILARRAHERERAHVEALRDERRRTVALLDNARGWGDRPFQNGEGVWGWAPAGAHPTTQPKSGSEWAAIFEGQVTSIDAELERLGEQVE